jgi:ribonuclease Z
MRSLLLVSLALSAALPAQDTRVILLGTGNPNPEPERSGPAVAVASGERVYLVDCGPGVVRRAAQAGLAMERITRAFVTHLHSDHTAGLPDLIFTPAVTGRRAPLELYGPPGLRAMTGHVMRAWREDVAIRLGHLEPAIRAAYDVRVRDVRPGEVYRDETARVTAFPVAHGGWKHAYGYRFEIGGKRIVISGDTTVSERLAQEAAGCDILVHEVYSQKGWEGRTPEWRRYHAAYHTSAPDLGRLAERVRPGKLVLYHQLPMGQSPDEVVGEVRRLFRGEVIYGRDLDVVR